MRNANKSVCLLLLQHFDWMLCTPIQWIVWLVCLLIRIDVNEMKRERARDHLNYFVLPAIQMMLSRRYCVAGFSACHNHLCYEKTAFDSFIGIDIGSVVLLFYVNNRHQSWNLRSQARVSLSTMKWNYSIQWLELNE